MYYICRGISSLIERTSCELTSVLKSFPKQLQMEDLRA